MWYVQKLSPEFYTCFNIDYNNTQEINNTCHIVIENSSKKVYEWNN